MILTKEFNNLYRKISKKALRLTKLPKNIKQFITFEYASTIKKDPISLYYCGYFVATIPLIREESDIYSSDFHTIHHIASIIRDRITLFAGKHSLDLLNKMLKLEEIIDE